MIALCIVYSNNLLSMSWPKLSIWILLVLLSCQSGRVSEKATATYEGDRFQEHIRTTEARTPEQERLGFKLPEGFKIELFASEPDIGKPMNIAFDAQGRLWVTQSHEYPFPAEPGEGVDKVSILEDTDGDGQADKFTHYVDTLNIPDRKSTRLNSSHSQQTRMPSSA